MKNDSQSNLPSSPSTLLYHLLSQCPQTPQQRLSSRLFLPEHPLEFDDLSVEGRKCSGVTNSKILKGAVKSEGRGLGEGPATWKWRSDQFRSPSSLKQRPKRQNREHSDSHIPLHHPSSSSIVPPPPLQRVNGFSPQHPLRLRSLLLQNQLLRRLGSNHLFLPQLPFEHLRLCVEV